MKKILLTITMLLTLGLSAQGVAAQVEAPAVDSDLEHVEGLESAYSRAYSIDIQALMEDPDFDIAAMDPADMAGNVGIQAYVFDSDDNAEKFLEDTRNQLDEGLESDELEDMEVEIKDLDGIDKDGFAVEMTMTGEMEINYAVVVFVDGNTVFQISGMDGSLEDSVARANGVAKFVADAEIETEEVTFAEDGTSTGGVFDRMPVAGDEVLGELVPSMDIDVLNFESGS